MPRDAGPSWRERLARTDAEQALPPEEALAEAERLVLSGQPFYAHEVLEGPWHLADQEERAFWQGLAQIAVGLTHIQRGNAVGAKSTLRSGAEKVAGYEDGHFGVAVTAVVRRARELADRVEQEGVDALTAEELLLPFR